jgi:hypothetical protein
VQQTLSSEASGPIGSIDGTPAQLHGVLERFFWAEQEPGVSSGTPKRRSDDPLAQPVTTSSPGLSSMLHMEPHSSGGASRDV